MVLLLGLVLRVQHMLHVVSETVLQHCMLLPGVWALLRLSMLVLLIQLLLLQVLLQFLGVRYDLDALSMQPFHGLSSLGRLTSRVQPLPWLDGGGICRIYPLPLVPGPP